MAKRGILKKDIGRTAGGLSAEASVCKLPAGFHKQTDGLPRRVTVRVK